MVKLLFLLLVAVISACGQSVDRAASIQANNKAPIEEETIQRRIQSRVKATGQFQISHQLLNDPVVGQITRIELSFQLQPLQNLEVIFNDSDDFELLGDSTQIVEGSDNGMIRTVVELVPNRAGKSYLKLIAATIDGEKVRSYAIVLKVRDQKGNLPEKQKSQVNRINLPSSSDY
ncbi:MAG: hypothetical protein V3T17_02055 [Pseudomonadales bacterium]